MVGGVRSVLSSGLQVKSSISDNESGLGILDRGVDYFFRVAVRNVNGDGPFSDLVSQRIPDVTSTSKN